MALDIYTLPCGTQPGGVLQRISQQNMRTKEEKEVLEHFSGVVSIALNIFNIAKTFIERQKNIGRRKFIALKVFQILYKTSRNISGVGFSNNKLSVKGFILLSSDAEM